MNYIMKIASVIIFSVMVLQYANAQETLDMSNMECTYRLTQMTDTITGKKREIDPAMILLAGSNYSKFYNYTAFRVDSMLNAISNPDFSATWTIAAENLHSEDYEIYRNTADNTVLFKDEMSGKVKVMYQETLPKQNWKISAETGQIAGYKCTKAICSFRGRNYVAWFTREIPVNAGPWKFHGLPGLIVKVHDTQEHYDFELYSVRSIKKAIVLEQKGYQKISFKDYIRLCKSRIANPLAGLTGFSQLTFKRDGVPFTPGAKQYDVMERSIK